MKTIEIADFLVTDEGWSLGRIEQVSIADVPSYRGAFGELFNCLSINNSVPKAPLLIKILSVPSQKKAKKGYDTITELQRRMIAAGDHILHLGYNNVTKVPGLKAFPIFSFEGFLEGKQIRGYASVNLLTMGYIPFTETNPDTGTQRSEYEKLPFHTRFQFCFHFACCFSILQSINYVHADINPQNFFINFTTGDLAIIDFDGGGIIDTAQDSTLSCGKLMDSEWLSPEVYQGLANNDEKIFLDKYCDRWSVMIGFHYLIFLDDPFFFIAEQSRNCKAKYLQNNSYYPINVSDDNVSEMAIYHLDTYDEIVRTQVPSDIYQHFINAIQKGFFDPAIRPDYSSWMTLFQRTQNGPAITYFQAENPGVLTGTTTILKWSVAGAHTIQINNGIGEVSETSEVSVTMEKTTTFILKATGHFGKIEQTITVWTFPLPIIESLKVPMPDLNSSLNLNLSISTPMFVIENTPLINLIPLTADFVRLAPDILSAKPHKNEPDVWPISFIFNKVKKMMEKWSQTF